MARKSKTNKMKSTAKTAAKAAVKGGKGKRLTEEQKSAIAEAGKTGVTMTSIAERFSVSMPTVARIIGKRRGVAKGGVATAAAPTGKKPGRPAKATTGDHGMLVSLDGDYIVVRIPRKHVLQHFVSDLLG